MGAIFLVVDAKSGQINLVQGSKVDIFGEGKIVDFEGLKLILAFLFNKPRLLAFDESKKEPAEFANHMRRMTKLFLIFNYQQSLLKLIIIPNIN